MSSEKFFQILKAALHGKISLRKTFKEHFLVIFISKTFMDGQMFFQENEILIEKMSFV